VVANGCSFPHYGVLITGPDDHRVYSFDGPEAVVVQTRLTQPATVTFAGRFRFGIYRWTYLPFVVPERVRRISVECGYDRFTALKGLANNVLDLGVFGPAGRHLGSLAGFRGWSGGARRGFELTTDAATPGYLAGPLEPGTWSVALGPVVLNPLGMRWWLSVTTDCDEAVPAVNPWRAPPAHRHDRGTGWYRGDLHLHTVHSDGQRTPAQMSQAATAAGLDFIASTEHNTNAANRDRWPDGDGDVLVIPGEEVTTRHGHWLAIGLPDGGWYDWRYRPRDRVFAGYAQQLRAAGGLVVAAHPAIPLPGAAWQFGYRDVDAIEVWIGAWTLDDEMALRIWDRLLRRGRRIVAVGGSDSHAPTDPVGRPQTVVQADAFATGAILAGLRGGRSYLAESAAVTLAVSATCCAAAVGPGQRLWAPAEVHAEIEGAPRSTLSMHTASGVVASAAVGASGRQELSWVARDPSHRFVRFEVRRAGRGWGVARPMVALSNPVWLD
jgi:hypothetical protein